MPVVDDRLIPDIPGEPVTGQYPYRYTQDDRFQYRVKVQPAGECLEFVVRAADTRLAAIADRNAWLGIGRGPRSAPSDDADREDSIRRSVERSRRMVRLLAINIRADRLVTFTTRFVYDRPTLQVIWDRFHRGCRRLMGGFQYVAVPEPHPSNPEHLHIHVAINGYIPVNRLRKLWHAAICSVDGGARAHAAAHGGTGGKGSPGNVDINYRGRSNGVKSTRRIASYIGKYITKDLLPIYNKKRYWVTKGVSLPDAQRKWLSADDLDEAVREVMRMHGLLVDQEYPPLQVWKPGNLAFFWVPVAGLPEPPF